MALAVQNLNSNGLHDLWSEKNLEKTLEASSWESKLGLLQINPKYSGEGKKEVLKENFGNLKYDSRGNVGLGHLGEWFCVRPSIC